MQLRTLNVGCFGGGTGLPSLARGPQDQPVVARPCHRDDVRQRRELRPVARRARRPSAGRRPALRAGARAQRARSAQRAARAALDAGARAAARAYRRQSPAVDDGALQRGFSRGRRWPARAPRLRGPRLAGLDRAGEYLRRVRGRSTTRGEVEVDAGQTAGHAITRLWLEPDVRAPPGRGEGHRRARRRRHRPRQLLYQPDAHPARARRARSRPREWPGPSSSSPIS